MTSREILSPRPVVRQHLIRCVCVAILFTPIAGCQPAEKTPVPVVPTTSPPALTATLDQTRCPFDIYWPPLDPDEAKPESVKPLLTGEVAIDVQEQKQGAAELRLAVTLTRPSQEEDRQYWNKVLAFADLPWMDDVRVWDADEKWIWPNLSYVLRLPGMERVERYGGRDPKKHVDNDFAAVLIRKYDADGQVESPETSDSPLVSAEWQPVGQIKTDLHTVAHSAKSDDFVLHVGAANQTQRGQLKVWLIYADFLNSKPPKTWPKQHEWAGGILAYFEVDWQTLPDGGCRGIVRPTRPTESTRFDWEHWVQRAPGSKYSEADVRLTDRGGNQK